MPIYEYRCEACEKLTEAIQRLDEPPLAICPHCGGRLEKLMSAPSFQFKGTGWYVTDYAGKSGTGRDSASSDSSAKVETGKKESGDKKPVDSGSSSAKAGESGSSSTS